MSQTFAPGTIIHEKYRIERELGAGGMGFVVLAFHLGLEERVAVKMLLPDALGDAEAVARFSREAKAAARIKSEHVARMLDVSALEDGTPYIVMEYLEGSDLEQIVEAKGPLEVEDAVDYVLQTCEALAEAHARGVVHRDLKPGNLHLSNRADGSPLVKVLDFGISKIATRENDGSVTTTSALLGSPLYMSPEQMKATRDVDGRSDIWAMGVVLYELLTAQSPFTAPSMPQVCARVLDTDPDPLPASANIPEGLRDVIMHCLEKKPETRYQDVAALAAALAPYAPARSQICIERIAKVIEAPLTSTSVRLCPTASRSAPTIDEADIAAARTPSRPKTQERTMPLPNRPGSETMTNATVSAGYRALRSNKATFAFGAGAFAFLISLVFLVHSFGIASADETPTTSAAVVPAVSALTTTNAVARTGPLAPASANVNANATATEAKFIAAPVAHETKPIDSERAQADEDSKPPQTQTAPPATTTPRSHHRAQDMSKYFGGRD